MNRLLLTCAVALVCVMSALLLYLHWYPAPAAGTGKRVTVQVEEGSVHLSNPQGSTDLAAGEDGEIVHGKTPHTINTPTISPDLSRTEPEPASPSSSLTLYVHNTEANMVTDATITVLQGDSQSVVFADEKGIAEIEGLNIGFANITITAPDIFAGNSLETSLEEGENEIHAYVAMRASFPAYLTNPQSTPVTGAQVTLTPSNDSQKVAEADLSPRQSDQDGKVNFSPLASGSYVVGITAPPYLPHHEKIAVVKDMETKTIILSERSEITVFVQDAESNPIGGAQVTLQSQSNNKGIYLDQQTNDLSGITVFKEVPAGSYIIIAKHSWFGDEGKGNKEIEVTQSRHKIELTLSNREYTISGKVYESESKKPIEGAEVVAFSDRRKDLPFNEQQWKTTAPDAQAVTGEGGEYTLQHLEGGTYIIGVKPHKDYMTIPISSNVRDFGAPDPTRVFLDREPDVENVDFPLLLPWTVSGTVSLNNGSPLAGVKISPSYIYTELGGMGMYSMSENDDKVLSAEDGTFRLVGHQQIFNDQLTVKISASDKVYQNPPSIEVHPKPGEEITGIDFIYENGIMIEGRVLDQRNKPIADANIIFWGNDTRKVESGQDGAYKLSLELGGYTTRATKKGFKHLESPLVIETGKTYNNIDFVLEEKDESFEGTVTDTNGNPVQNLNVHLYSVQVMDAGGRSVYGISFSKTDSNGDFLLQPEQVWQQEFTHFEIKAGDTEEYERAVYTTTNWGEKDIHLTVKRRDDGKASIRGRVLDANGKPVNRFTVRVIPSGHSGFANNSFYSWRAIFHPDGEFLLDQLPVSDGPFVIAAKTEESAHAFSPTINLQENEVRENVTITLQTSFSVYGKIMDSAGVPVEKAFFEFQRDFSKLDWNVHNDILPRTESDELGRFTLTDIPLAGGPLKLRSTYYSSRQFTEKEVIIPAGQANESRNLGTIVVESGSSPDQ